MPDGRPAHASDAQQRPAALWYAMPINRYTADPAHTIDPDLPVTEVGSREGPRMRFGSVAGWIEVRNAGNFADAGAGDPGLFTRGQFICIGVTLIQWDGASWARARMAHISSTRASLIRDPGSAFYTGWTAVPGDRLWLVVGAKSGIAFGELVGFVESALPNLQSAHVWEYAISTTESIGSAVSVRGLFGEPPAA